MKRWRYEEIWWSVSLLDGFSSYSLETENELIVETSVVVKPLSSEGGKKRIWIWILWIIYIPTQENWWRDRDHRCVMANQQTSREDCQTTQSSWWLDLSLSISPNHNHNQYMFCFLLNDPSFVDLGCRRLMTWSLTLLFPCSSFLLLTYLITHQL